MNNNEKIKKLVNKYLTDEQSKERFYEIINPIIVHDEFQRRLTDEFLHHSDITLGEHIIEDAILTYLYSIKKKNLNIDIAVKIAMFHDLYTIPWQNNKKNTKVKKFTNKHGFRHPVEAAINACYWFPNEFKNEETSRMIIDGIIHHMYPLPVTRINKNNINKCEIKNYDRFLEIPDNLKKIIYESCNRGKLFKVSICKSKYKEGRIMSKMDKRSSLKQIKNVSSAFALITGKNKSLKK